MDGVFPGNRYWNPEGLTAHKAKKTGLRSYLSFLRPVIIQLGFLKREP